MMNKPVAWMHKESGQVFAGMGSPLKPDDFIPLYTHPPQKPMMVLNGNRVYPTVKELTDEEIEAIMYKCDWSYDPVSFAKAILRKAQEK